MSKVNLYSMKTNKVIHRFRNYHLINLKTVRFTSASGSKVTGAAEAFSTGRMAPSMKAIGEIVRIACSS